MPSRSFGDGLPSLHGTRANYVHEVDAQVLYRLCYALAERSFGDIRLWHDCEEIPSLFAEAVITKLIDQVSGDSFKDTLTYVCEISDDTHEYSYPRQKKKPEEGCLTATFEIQQVGCLKIGAAIESLEQEERFLGAAFYLMLCRSLYRRIWAYTHHDAGYYKEQVEEWREMEDPESRDAYEIPKVDEAIPEAVHTLENVIGQCDPHQLRPLLRRHLHGPYGLWIKKLLTIHRLSRLPVDSVRFEDEYDCHPVPSVLILFKDHDAIEECFDQEEEHYQQCSCEPTCAVSFRPDVKDEFDAAYRTMAIFLKLNREFAELITLLNKWEKAHGRRHQHRAKPALPAH